MESSALTSAIPFDARLSDVFSFHVAIRVLNQSIEIDDENPGFLFDWDQNNLNAFVAAANGLNPALAPAWLRTAPPDITANSFTDDVVHELQQVAGHCGRVLLASADQITAISGMLFNLQHEDFLQDAAQVALPVVNQVEQHVLSYRNESAAVASEQPPSTSPRLSTLRRLFI
ncbi:hypothetical protein PRIC1_013471 [Phytophthora ramorum]